MAFNIGGGGSTTPTYPMHGGPGGISGHCVHDWAPTRDPEDRLEQPHPDPPFPTYALYPREAFHNYEYYQPVSSPKEKEAVNELSQSPLTGVPAARIEDRAPRNSIDLAPSTTPNQQARSKPEWFVQGRLLRSLHIPSRHSTISSGFEMPLCLLDCGVSELRWNLFQKEIRKHASMSISQWGTCIISGWAYGTLFSAATGFFGPFIWIVITHKMRKQREQHNWIAAIACGAINHCLDRWNLDYFEPMGLHATVEPPGCGNMADSDVTSTKLFKYHQKHGFASEQPGCARKFAGVKELRCQYKEGRGRTVAARRGRIVVLPLNLVPEWARGQIKDRDRRKFEATGVFAEARQKAGIKDGPGERQRVSRSISDLISDSNAPCRTLLRSA